MIQEYLVLAERIRSEVADLEKLDNRAERAIIASHQRSEDQDLYIDSAALSLHDLYSGLERIFRQIAATVDDNVPSNQEWHRDLLQLRHVVRNIYAFSLIPAQIERLVVQFKGIFSQIRIELLSFVDFLEQVGRD